MRTFDTTVSSDCTLSASLIPTSHSMYLQYVHVGSSFPALDHDDMISLTRLDLSPFGLRRRADFELESHIFELGKQVAPRLPAQ